MVRYFYAWTPVLFVGTVCILSLPWLGLIALMIVALVALPALALAIVIAPYMLGRGLTRLWRRQGNAILRSAPALDVGRSYAHAAWRGIDPTPQLVRSTDSTSRASAFRKRAAS